MSPIDLKWHTLFQQRKQFDHDFGMQFDESIEIENKHHQDVHIHFNMTSLQNSNSRPATHAIRIYGIFNGNTQCEIDSIDAKQSIYENKISSFVLLFGCSELISSVCF